MHVCRGVMVELKCSGSSENALRNPSCEKGDEAGA